MVLVPANPVFGCRELTGREVRVSRTPTHLVVAAGPWSVWLPVDATGRNPDVAAVIPRPAGGSVAGVDGRDAAALLDALLHLPGAEDEDRPVALDLNGWVVVRARDAETCEVREVALTRSPAAGPPARVAVDRKTLARALALGCHTLRLAGDGKLLVAEGDDKTFVAMCLDPDLVVPPDPGAVRVATHERTGPPPQHLGVRLQLPQHFERLALCVVVRAGEPHQGGIDGGPGRLHRLDQVLPLAEADDLTWDGRAGGIGHDGDVAVAGITGRSGCRGPGDSRQLYSTVPTCRSALATGVNPLANGWLV
jgi:hypothetical protein